MVFLQITEPEAAPSIPPAPAYVIGIDLGTTNSLASVVKPDGTQTLIPLTDSGHVSLPSVVAYQAPDQIQVGIAASKLPSDAFLIQSSKRLIGRSAQELESQRDSFPYPLSLQQKAEAVISTPCGPQTAVDVATHLLSRIKDCAEQFLQAPVEQAVVTVPAYFDDMQRQATQRAAQLAGLQVLRLINEPTAAAIAYGFDQAQVKEQYYLVYDLGGGTFDVSILQLSQGVFEVIATNGDTHLGGDDFDRSIAQWFALQHQVSWEALDHSAQRQIIQAAQQAREALSEHTQTHLTVALDQYSYTSTLSREVLSQLLDPLLTKTLKVVLRALHDSSLEIQDIAEFILVGGPTRMPILRHRLTQFFERPPYVGLNPDEAVAAGAAIYANRLATAQHNQNLLLLDVVPISLNIEVLGGLVETIIPRNTSIPCQRTKQFTTARDGQTALSIHVLQGERTCTKDCRSLAKFELTGLAPRPAGSLKISICFQVDSNGILHVSAHEPSTGIEQTLAVNPSHQLDGTAILDMLSSSQMHLSDDIQARLKIQAFQEAKQLVYAVQTALVQDGHLLKKQPRTEIDQAILKLEASLQADAPPTEITELTKQLNCLTETFASLRVSQSVAKALSGKPVETIHKLLSGSSSNHQG